jgi:hypothetical protein
VGNNKHPSRYEIVELMKKLVEWNMIFPKHWLMAQRESEVTNYGGDWAYRKYKFTQQLELNHIRKSYKIATSK